MPDERIMDEHIDEIEHLSAGDVAAYLDGTLEEAERDRVEAHAAECKACRRELTEVARQIRGMRRVPRGLVWAPIAAAAAIIAVLVAQPFGTVTQPERTSRFRGPESTAGRQGGVAIGILAPPSDGTVNPAAVTFVWHAGGAGASYHLTVTNDVGGVVWTLTTTDTVAALPDTVTLARDSRYHWYVDGLFEDGRRASSGVHSFTTAR